MLNLNTYAEAGKASIEALTGLNNQALDSVEKLTALNLQAAKTTLAELQESTQAVLAAKTPEDLAALQTAALKSAPEKALAYARHVKEIVTAVTAQQRTAFEAQAADIQAKFVEAVDGALEKVPGSEAARQAVKTTVEAFNTGYGTLIKAVEQFAGAVEANVAKLATIKA